MKTSFWDYLATFPGSFEAQLFSALLLSGSLGMIGNYMVKWAKNEIEGSLWCYLFHSNVRLTVLAFLSFIGLSITSISAGIFVLEGKFIGWPAVIWFGATNGFTVDAIVNKGTRQNWTAAERDAKLNSKGTAQ